MAKKKLTTMKAINRNKSKKKMNMLSKKKSKKRSNKKGNKKVNKKGNKKVSNKEGKMECNINSQMGFMNVYEIPELKRIITQYSYEPKEHVVYQGYTDDTIEKFKNKGNVHDTIYYCTDNQMGCVRYRIIMNENNEKDIEQIWSAMDEGYF